jgi:endogenous inhibitor of DNA gyrase (YacG/DUF329 family)
MTGPLTGQVYQINCTECGTTFSGTITRRGRRQRFCSEKCRHAATLKWKSKHNLKRRDAARGPMLPFGDEDAHR